MEVVLVALNQSPSTRSSSTWPTVELLMTSISRWSRAGRRVRGLGRCLATMAPPRTCVQRTSCLVRRIVLLIPLLLTYMLLTSVDTWTREQFGMSVVRSRRWTRLRCGSSRLRWTLGSSKSSSLLLQWTRWLPLERLCWTASIVALSMSPFVLELQILPENPRLLTLSTVILVATSWQWQPLLQQAWPQVLASGLWQCPLCLLATSPSSCLLPLGLNRMSWLTPWASLSI